MAKLLADRGAVVVDADALAREVVAPGTEGLARVRDGRIVATTGWLIQPPSGHDRFFELNIRIHGIEPEDVIGAKGCREHLNR